MALSPRTIALTFTALSQSLRWDWDVMKGAAVGKVRLLRHPISNATSATEHPSPEEQARRDAFWAASK